VLHRAGFHVTKGIEFIETEESYTSKSSFLDNRHLLKSDFCLGAVKVSVSFPEMFNDIIPSLGEKPEGCEPSGNRSGRLLNPRRFSAGISQRINCLIDAQSWCNLRKRT
jgi:hypothetical protein